MNVTVKERQEIFKKLIIRAYEEKDWELAMFLEEESRK